jgi:hypothetical protein
VDNNYIPVVSAIDAAAHPLTAPTGERITTTNVNAQHATTRVIVRRLVRPDADVAARILRAQPGAPPSVTIDRLRLNGLPAVEYGAQADTLAGVTWLVR